MILINLWFIYTEMSVICVICNQRVTKVKAPGIVCSACQDNVHATCVNQEANFNSFVTGTLTFFCNKCKSKNRKSVLPSNELSLTQSSVTSGLSTAVSSSTLSVSNQPSLSSIMEILKDIQSSQQFLSDKYDTITAEIVKLSANIAAIANENLLLKKENLDLKSKLKRIDLDVAQLKQDSLQNNMIISNVPKLIDESPLTLQKFVKNAINNDNISKSIIDMYRERKIYNTKNTLNHVPNMENVVIKFGNAEAKVDLFKIRKDVANRLATSLNISNSLFLNDHLTPYFNNLFNMARVLKHRANYKYIWSRNGCIFAKRDDENSTRTIKISSFDQLQAMFKTHGINKTIDLDATTKD